MNLLLSENIDNKEVVKATIKKWLPYSFKAVAALEPEFETKKIHLKEFHENFLHDMGLL